MVFWSCPFIYFKWILVIGKTGNIYKQKIKNKKTNQTLLLHFSLLSALLLCLYLFSCLFHLTSSLPNQPQETQWLLNRTLWMTHERRNRVIHFPPRPNQPQGPQEPRQLTHQRSWVLQFQPFNYQRMRYM